MVDYQFRTNILEKVYGTQKELAENLGVTPRTLRNYKSGNTEPTQSVRDKINRRWNYYKDQYGVYMDASGETEIDGEKVKVHRRTDLFEMDEGVKEKVESEVEQQMMEDGGYDGDSSQPKVGSGVEITGMDFKLKRFSQ